MVGYYITPEQGIVSSEGRVCKEDYLAWLLQDSEEDGVFPDLDYAVAALLKLIGATERQGRSLLETHKLFYVDDRKRAFKLTYYPSKYAGLDFGSMSNHSYRSFYHMEQYRDFPHLRDSTFAYAQSQAKEAKEVGESVLKAYRKIGITKDTLTSPIKAFIKSNLYPVIPTVDQIPAEAGEFAYGCVRGNWVESFKIGGFPMAFDADINGAYAYELSQLLDLRRGHWVSSPAYELEATYGFCRGILNITAPFHPFIVGEGEMKYTPTGNLGEQYITKAEWDFILQYNIGDFDCQEGWWWVQNPNQQPYQIFKGVVNRLWSLRQNADPLTDKILKRVTSGIWGSLGQTMGSGDKLQFGERFNPVYHALCESNCRLAVARAVLDNELYSSLINIAVDGVVCTKPIPVDDGKLGGWRLSHKGKAIVVSSGIVGIEEKDSEQDFAITYDKLYSMISANPKAKVYRMSKVSPITLGKSLAGDRWDELGNLETVIRTISVKEEGKRLYTKVPKCGGDLLTNIYSSEPWDVSVIRKPGLLTAPVEDDH